MKLRLLLYLLLFISLQGFSQNTLSREEATEFGRLSIMYGGRISTIDSYALDFTKKITGSSSYKDYNAVQILAGWLFFPEQWENESIIKLKNKEIKRKVGNEDFQKLTDFFYPEGAYRLPYLGVELDDKSAREVDEKVNLIISLKNGQSLKIFPQNNNIWYAPLDELKAIKTDDTIFIRNVISLLSEYVHNGDRKGTLDVIEKISRFQNLRTKEGVTSSFHKSMEIFYNRINVPNILFKINLLLGILGFMYLIWSMVRGKQKRWIKILLFTESILCFTFLTLLLSLRWYLTGHMPMGGGYETMLFVSWLILLITILFCKNNQIFLVGGVLISGFTLLVSSISGMNPQLTPLVPVLNSPWLVLHVSLIMIAYALMTFLTFNSLTAIIISIREKNMRDKKIIILYSFSKKILYPTVSFLILGIIIGAVWANESWGRYWGWDPKEVWALITAIVYSVLLHSKQLPLLRNPFVFHLYLLFAFICVIMTYFGVSMFLGGMHSY